MKILEQTEFKKPVQMFPGDSIILSRNDKEIISHQLPSGPCHTFTHALIFQLEPGDFGFQGGLGGMLVEKAK